MEHPEGFGPERPHKQQAEHCEVEPEQHPRIYVASLSDYNAGRLHGVWIDADTHDDNVWQQVTAMLANSPEPNAEEFAIHDYDGFGAVRLGEYERVETVTEVARGIAEYGLAYAAWADYLGSSRWAQLDGFEDAYLGEWESVTAYAAELIDDIGVDPDALGPEWLSPYITVNVEAFGRDLQLSSDIAVVEADNRVYVFEP